jgi:haloalkane dehalogenase
MAHGRESIIAGMEILRTPDERFAALPSFPYEPHYVHVASGDGDTMRVHFLDAGPRTAPVVLMLHGEPSWCFLYRKCVAVCVAAGLRVVAPDLVGFGRSDKPAAREDYTYQRHVDWMRAVLEALDLRDVTLLCQDWGGLIGLRLVAEHQDRFARVVAANTFLPTGDQPASGSFLKWQKFSQETPVFEVSKIIGRSVARPLAPEVLAAYDAPFPDETFKAGARQFPLLVPTRPDDPASAANRAAWDVLRRFDKPFLTAFGDSDPITRGADMLLQALIPGTKGQPHTTLEKAGHFLQEDAGEALGEVVVKFAR